MQEENQIVCLKIVAGVVIVGFYVLTGMDGLLIVIAAFLLGFPLDKLVSKKNE